MFDRSQRTGEVADINAVSVEPTGNIYVVGGSASSDFLRVNAYDSALSGSSDAFLTKISPTGTVLFSTYLGGLNALGSESGLAVAVDAAGALYLTGQASSTAFPTTSGAYQTGLSGNSDAFITKFAAAGNALVFSTLLGGSGSNDTGRG